MKRLSSRIAISLLVLTVGMLLPPRANAEVVCNPPVDFRHQGVRKIDPVTKQIVNEGMALAVMTDGRTRPLKQKQVTDKMFLRFGLQN